MGKIKNRRKPRLDETRVKVIVATFEMEVGSKNFEICGVGVCSGDTNEWQVIVRSILPKGIFLDGGDAMIMVNDQTGKARYYADYVKERDNQNSE